MNTEEKAAAYDKAILRATQEWECGLMTREKLEELFPELAESEDEKIRKEITEFIYKNADRGEELEKRKNWLAWLDKQGEQKPELNDEDEIKLNDVIRLIENSGNVESIRKHYIDWLKSLRPQKQQEWSKEDIDMIDWLIRCCEKEHEELCNDKYGHQDIVSDLKRDCRKKWDWLESLKNKIAPQSHWKPTEEQMDALEDAIRYGEVENVGILSLLYNDLKEF